MFHTGLGGLPLEVIVGASTKANRWLESSAAPSLYKRLTGSQLFWSAMLQKWILAANSLLVKLKPSSSKKRRMLFSPILSFDDNSILFIDGIPLFYKDI